MAYNLQLQFIASHLLFYFSIGRSRTLQLVGFLR